MLFVSNAFIHLPSSNLDSAARRGYEDALRNQPAFLLLWLSLPLLKSIPNGLHIKLADRLQSPSQGTLSQSKDSAEAGGRYSCHP